VIRLIVPTKVRAYPRLIVRQCNSERFWENPNVVVLGGSDYHLLAFTQARGVSPVCFLKKELNTVFVSDLILYGKKIGQLTINFF
jgi:hypothetical protein